MSNNNSFVFLLITIAAVLFVVVVVVCRNVYSESQKFDGKYISFYKQQQTNTKYFTKKIYQSNLF
jgi:hypothetical protein